MNHKSLVHIVSAAVFAVLTTTVVSATASLPEYGITEGQTEPIHSGAVSFPDVTSDKWFYSDVTALADKGIINGFPNGNFYPENEVSNAEFLKILFESLEFDIDAPVGQKIFADNWASEYLSLAYAMDFVTDEDINSGFLPDAPITRADMTRLTVLALGMEPSLGDDPFSDGSDGYARTAFNEYILQGMPDKNNGRLYNGDKTTTRSEAAAIAMRIIAYKADSYGYFRDQVLANAESNSLDTEAELIDLFYVLNREFISEYTFKTSVPIKTWTEYYHLANLIYLEYFYSSELQCSYIPGNNSYKLTLKYDSDFDTLKVFHSAANDLAASAISEILNGDMTAEMRVKAIHDYLILSCEYDYSNYKDDTIPFESRIAFGPLYRGEAVCQGYTAAFNMLCRLAGIRSIAVTGTSPASEDVHVWNMILLDDEVLDLDVTHDDPVPDKKGQISYKYYLRTEGEMIMLGYLWDKNQTQLKYLY